MLRQVALPARGSPELELWQPPHKGPEFILSLGGQCGPLQLWVYLWREKPQQEVQVVDAQRICDNVEACSAPKLSSA